MIWSFAKISQTVHPTLIYGRHETLSQFFSTSLSETIWGLPLLWSSCVGSGKLIKTRTMVMTNSRWIPPTSFTLFVWLSYDIRSRSWVIIYLVLPPCLSLFLPKVWKAKSNFTWSLSGNKVGKLSLYLGNHKEVGSQNRLFSKDSFICSQMVSNPEPNEHLNPSWASFVMTDNWAMTERLSELIDVDQ